MPRAVPEIIQRLWGTILDLVIPDRSPRWIGEYQTTNRLVRTLAQLVAQDGTHARLLKCDSSGRLYVLTEAGTDLPVSDYHLVTAPTGQAELTVTSETPDGYDFTAAADRLVVASLSADTGILWDADTSGGMTRPLGLIGASVWYTFFMQGRYLDVYKNAAGDGTVHLRWWAL